MTKQIQLISLYCTVCVYYDSRLAAIAQRFSNNSCPKFTDEECLTVYLFGILEQKFTVKAIYNFIKDYYPDWFPNLPSYQAFNRKVCFLNEAFVALAGLLMDLGRISPDISDFLMDSMPIVVAKQSRSSRAKAASGLCNKGYCSTKKMYYYGIKMHIVGQKIPGALPKPACFEITPASVHDLSAARVFLEDARNMDIFCDKIYIDRNWFAKLSEVDVRIFTPIKLEKGQKELSEADRPVSAAISRARQPIESFFNWIHEKTNIQIASKVRSGRGLISFVFARISAACLLLYC